VNITGPVGVSPQMTFWLETPAPSPDWRRQRLCGRRRRDRRNSRQIMLADEAICAIGLDVLGRFDMRTNRWA
jgi:hypothetical protein